MTVHDLECPNCGAAVDFGGRAQTTCPFCRSVLALSNGAITAQSELNDLLTSAPIQRVAPAPQSIAAADAHWLDFSDVAELARHGRQAEAITLYRQRTGVGVNEARYVVEALALGETPASAQPAAPPRQTRLAALGCLSLLLFVGACAAFVLVAGQIMFRVWGPLDEALSVINNDFQVKGVLGYPIAADLLVSGELQGRGGSSTAKLSVPIHGSLRSGELRVNGTWRRGVWDLNIWVIYDDGGAKAIALTRQVK